MAIQLTNQSTIKLAKKNAVKLANNPVIGRLGHRGIPVLLQQLAALLGLIVISPLLLIVMLLIKCESRGPVLFCQVRVGEFGRHFNMYKFRSMYLENDPRFQAPDPTKSSRDGVCKKYINDPRITRIGRFIRKYSIDELPQLLNVVLGDMCLVGPRPALAIESYQYSFAQQQRLNSKPGLTGLWQVSGRADTSFNEQINLDTTYVKQQSIWLDLKILYLTVPAVLGAKGAY